jgi:predicted TIM-barrel fold metal-dependent hydrolase
MKNLRYISADSHLMEPLDLWVTRVDRGFRDRAPHVVKRAGRPNYVLVAPDMQPFPIAANFAAGRSREELRDFIGNSGPEAARPSGWDPAERIKDQAIDGVEAEVLYTSLGLPLFSLKDGDLQRECFRVFNDFLAEFVSHNRKRLIGIGMVSLEDIRAGVDELERIARLGLRGAMISGAPPEERPYASSVYDPFWQAASALDMPLSLHVITGSDEASRKRGVPLAGNTGGLSVPEAYTFMIHEIQRSLASLIFGGVFERFPRLKIVSAENDVGWLPHFMYRLDHADEKFGAMIAQPLPHRPSEYIRRQLWAAFLDDPIGPATYKLFGEDQYMWGSDFPHTDSTWPKSRQVIERNFAGVPTDVRTKMVFTNVAKLYGLEESGAQRGNED